MLTSTFPRTRLPISIWGPTRRGFIRVLRLAEAMAYRQVRGIGSIDSSMAPAPLS